MKTCDYNVSVMVRKHFVNVLNEIGHVSDISKNDTKIFHQAWGINVWENGLGISFEGNIEEINWKIGENKVSYNGC